MIQSGTFHNIAYGVYAVLDLLTDFNAMQPPTGRLPVSFGAALTFGAMNILTSSSFQTQTDAMRRNGKGLLASITDLFVSGLPAHLLSIF